MKRLVVLLAALGAVSTIVATSAMASPTQAAHPTKMTADLQVYRLLGRGEAAYRAWAAVRSTDATTMLNAAMDLQASITDVKAELSVTRGSSPKVDSARRLMIQAYGSLLKAADVAEKMQNNALQIPSCGGNPSCNETLLAATVALKGPLMSDLVSYGSLRNAAYKTLTRG